MRRIGRELGVEAMSLYNHVEDKDDILEGVTERVMNEFEFLHRRMGRRRPSDVSRVAPPPRPASERLPAPGGASQAARRSRDVPGDGLRARGAASRWSVGPRRRAGVQRPGRLHPGFRDDGAGTDARQRRRPCTGARSRDRRVEGPASSTRWSVPYFADCTTDQQFDFGLDLMIRGIQAGVDGPSAQPHAGRARRPRRPNASSASARSPSLWSAVTIVRTRAEPSRPWGTRWRGRTPLLEQPSRELLRPLLVPGDHRRDRRLALPVSNPSSCSPALNDRVFDHKRSSRSGSSSMMSSASMHAATAAGGALVENR